MPIRASVTNAETLTINGLDSVIPQKQWKVWLEDVAELIHERIAKAFENESAAGKALGRNLSSTTQAKATEGADLRRGHMFGDLQDGLDRGGYDTISQSKTRAIIKFDQNKLYNIVPHALYYARTKVAGHRILVVLQRDARMAEKYLTARAKEYAQGIERTGRRSTRSRREATRRAGNKILDAVVRFLRRL